MRSGKIYIIGLNDAMARTTKFLESQREDARVEGIALSYQSSEIFSRPRSRYLCSSRRPLAAEESIGMKQNLIRAMALHHAIANNIVLITNGGMAFEDILMTRKQHG